MNKIHFILSALFFVIMANDLYAQDGRPNERGEIRDAEFIIRKDRVLTLPKQSRIFERTPTLPQAQSQGNYSYEVKNFFLDLEPVMTDTPPFLKNFQVRKNELYHGYVKAGFGNYKSPLAELYLSSVESDYRNFGILLKHHGAYEGPVDGANSAEDHTKIQLNGSLFTENSEFFGTLGYARDRHHFYGYTPPVGLEIQPEDIRQIFHNVHGKIGLRKIDRMELFYYEAAVSLRLFNDNFLAREHEAGLNAVIGMRANDYFGGKILADVYFTSPSDQNYSDINRNYFRFNPYLEYIKNGINIKAGANVIHENDVVPNKPSDFHIFPMVTASYHLSDFFGIFAGYAGDVQRNTYYGFAMENPFLGPSEQLRNTIQNYEVNAGIQGVINGEFDYKFGVKYGEFANMHFYGNHTADSTKFEIVYDNTTQVLNYNASLGYQYDDWYRLRATADYYQYDLSELEGAWHRPEWEVRLNNTFAIRDKLLLHANANLMGGIAVINFDSGERDVLNPVLDLGLKADYSISPRFSVFAEGNNLLNQKNERFWNYRVRGIQGLAGLGFKF